LPSKRSCLTFLGIVVAFAVIGVAAGVGWWLWWRPAPHGVVYEHHPFFLPDEEFRSTGTYVAIAAPVGLVLGVVGTWRLRRDPLMTVLSLVAGAVAGGAAMVLTGWLLGPESALALARHAKDGATAHAALRVQPGAAWCVMPVATAIGCLGVLLSTDTHRPREMAHDGS
jgi:membrane protein DedA with SNARE-associated domain